MIKKIKNFLKDERGMTAITCALVMPLVISISFLTLEVGSVQINKTALIAASDSASLAAINALAGQGNFQSAASVAQAMFNANYNGNAIVTVSVTQGYLDTTQIRFYPGTSVVSSGCPSTSNCVPAVQTHITGTIKSVTGSLPNGIPVNITSTAIPINSGKALVNAAYPIAVDQCVMDNYWDSLHNHPVYDQVGNCQIINFGYKSRDPNGRCVRTSQWTTMQSSGDLGNVSSQSRNGNSQIVKSGDSIRMMTGTSNYESYFTVGQEITVPVTSKTGDSSDKIVGFTTIKITAVTPGTNDTGYITGCLENKSNSKMTENDGTEKQYGTTGLGARLVRDH
jgi:Flp pilus assembly protein TadG